jgi:cobalamin synthase
MTLRRTNMTTLLRRLLCGTAGVAMVVALLLPWTAVQDADRVAWGLWKLTFPLCVTLAVCALTTAITGGRIGLNRPDVSIVGATDGLGVITTATLAWLLFYSLPAHASLQPALILALVCAAVAALAAADYRPLRGAPLFPRLVDERGSGQRLGRALDQ